MADKCYHCGAQGIHLSWEPSLKNWLCYECSNDFACMNPMRAYCEKCDGEFHTEILHPPFICPKCVWMNDGPTDDDDEHKITNEPAKMTLLPATTDKMCVERAIMFHTDKFGYDKVGKSSVIQLVAPYIREKFNLNPEDIAVVSTIKTLAMLQGIELKEMIKKLYGCAIYEESIAYIQQIHTEIAMGAYDARMLDRRNYIETGIKTYNHILYEKNLEATFCPRKDDEYADTPF